MTGKRRVTGYGSIGDAPTPKKVRVLDEAIVAAPPSPDKTLSSGGLEDEEVGKEATAPPPPDKTLSSRELEDEDAGEEPTASIPPDKLLSSRELEDEDAEEEPTATSNLRGPPTNSALLR